VYTSGVFDHVAVGRTGDETQFDGRFAGWEVDPMSGHGDLVPKGRRAI